VAYQDGGNSNYGTAVVLSITDGVVSVGTEAVFCAATTTYISVCALTDNKVSVVYNKTSSLYCNILTIDRTNISVSTSKQIITKNGTYTSSVALTDSKVFVAYIDSYPYGIVLTIDGTVITQGAEMKLTSDTSCSHAFVCALTDTKVVVFYSTGVYGCAIVASVEGTTISVGTKVIFAGQAGAQISYKNAVKLAEDKILVAYQYISSVRARVLTIDGTAITQGAEMTFDSSGASYISATVLENNKVLVVYNSSGGKAQVLTIDATTVTAGTATVFYSATSSYCFAVALSSNSALVVYDSSLGGYKGLSIDGDTITVDETTSNGTKVQKATSNLHNVGVAKTSGTAGQTVEVYCAV
jgi:hypothetical protein